MAIGAVLGVASGVASMFGGRPDNSAQIGAQAYQNTLSRRKTQIMNDYRSSAYERTVQQVYKQFDENYADADEIVKAEEYLTAFSDAIGKNQIKWSDNLSATFMRLARPILNILKGKGFSKMEFKNGRDVYDFIKDYQANIKKGKVSKRGQAAQARAVVAAGEAGVSGLSVQALMDDYIRQQAGQVAALTSQDKLYALRHGLNLQQLGMASEQEILGLSKPINKPSALGLALNVGSSALSGYSTYKTLQLASNPAYIGTGMGTSSYMPDTDQYTLPVRGPLAIRGR